jgi:hypothetical protein
MAITFESTTSTTTLEAKVIMRIIAATLIAMSFVGALYAQTAPSASSQTGASSATAPLPSWAIGPFTRQANPEPVIKPNPDATFLNPINKETVHWERAWVYNPAAVARDGKIVVLYRSQQGARNTCSRIGYAESDDGFHFTCDPTPVYYPDNDDQQSFEWKGTESSGGCEDPRIAPPWPMAGTLVQDPPRPCARP